MKSGIINAPTSPGTKGDPFARSNEEYDRLKNPQNGKIPEGIAGRQNGFAKTLPKIEEIRMQKLAKGEKVNNIGWKQRGPFHTAGRTRSLALDIRNEDIIISGGASGGIWKSTDNGKTWAKKTRTDQIPSFSYVIQDTRTGKEDTWYVATGEVSGGNCMARDYLPYRGDGIYKSTDNGETWELLESTSYQRPQDNYYFSWVFKLAIDASNLEEDEIYAAAYGTIYRSINGGGTWTAVLGGSSASGYYTDVAVTTDGTAYAVFNEGLEKGIWRSEDGLNWTEITPSNFPSNYNRVILAVAPSNENIVYFFADISDLSNVTWQLGTIDTDQILWKYTYIRGDGSGSRGIWDDRSNNLPNDFQTGYSYTLGIGVSPENENLVLLGGNFYYRSINGFTNTLETVQIGGNLDLHPYAHCDVHQFVFSYQDPKILYAAQDGGICKTADITADDLNWERLDKGIVTTQFYSVAISPDIEDDKRIIAGAHDHGVFYTDNENSLWKVASGDGGYAAIIDNGTKYISGTYAAETYMSDNPAAKDLYDAVHDGDDLSEFSATRINPDIELPLLFNPFVPDPFDDRIIYMAGEENLWRCDDITEIPMDLSDNSKTEYWNVISTAASYVTAIGVSKDPAHILFYGTREGQIFRLDNSMENNPDPIDVYSGKGLPYNSYVSNIDVDPHDADHVIVSFCNYEVLSIYESLDRGETWTCVSGNLEQRTNGSGNGPAVFWVEMLHESGGITYFAGTSTGLYSTTELDGMNTVWAQEGAETIGNAQVKMIATREVDGEVVIATYGSGIYSRDFTTAVNEDNPIRTPDNFELCQNYPNPFNPSTTISFRLPSPADVTLKIYNIKGQLVKTLISRKIPSGEHKIRWNGINDSGVRVSSGTYIYTLKAGNAQTSKRMVFLK
ncbi:FlgD immunoglobulin-like domain containing protein [candidate division KSB1 bacterium]